MKNTALLALLLCVASGLRAERNETYAVRPIPAEVRERLGLDEFYRKRVVVGGFSIVGSAKVSDFALAEAGYLIRRMVGERNDLLAALDANKTRLAIMARAEFTTHIPEHAHLRPALYWNKRARGLGADPSSERPCVSCGEENLIGLETDPYAKESILIHEFAHALHRPALVNLDPTFQDRLDATYEKAIEKGLWRGAYAATNSHEYWAEGVQSWFGSNRENDREHNHVNTRAELIAYDPDLAKLIENAFGSRQWTYRKPADRKPPSPHLKGFDLAKEAPFRWPHELTAWYERFERGLESLAPEGAPELKPMKPNAKKARLSRQSARRTDFYLRNLSDKPVRVDWINFEGKPIRYAELRPKDHRQFGSFSKHVWQLANPDTNATLARYRLPDADASQVNLKTSTPLDPPRKR